MKISLAPNSHPQKIYFLFPITTRQIYPILFVRAMAITRLPQPPPRKSTSPFLYTATLYPASASSCSSDVDSGGSASICLNASSRASAYSQFYPRYVGAKNIRCWAQSCSGVRIKLGRKTPWTISTAGFFFRVQRVHVIHAMMKSIIDPAAIVGLNAGWMLLRYSIVRDFGLTY